MNCTEKMESFNTQFSLFFSLLLIFLHSLTQATTPPLGTIERNTKQQILATLPPTDNQDTPTSASSQLFLTSPSGKYEAYLLRRVTSPGAGGFGNEFCYIQVQEAGHSVWESECAVVSNVNTCSLVLSDAGLAIFDGSRSTWDTDVDGDQLETLVLLDSGDMQIREKDGDLAWKASDNPIANQECGSVGSPGLAPAYPPFAKPIPGAGINFGQPSGNQQQQPPLAYQQQKGQPSLGFQQQPLNQDGLNQPFGMINNQPLVDNTPFDSGSSRGRGMPTMVALVLPSLLSLLAFPFLLL